MTSRFFGLYWKVPFSISGYYNQTNRKVRTENGDIHIYFFPLLVKICGMYTSCFYWFLNFLTAGMHHYFLISRLISFYYGTHCFICFKQNHFYQRAILIYESGNIVLSHVNAVYAILHTIS